jgi:5'(3')-deoxyribonucleotidase
MNKTNKIERVFLDLDGCITNFVSGALNALGVTSYEIPPGEGKIEKWKGIGVSTRQFWKSIDATNEYFWADLPKYEWSDQLVQLLEEESGGNLHVLTSPSRNPYCLAGKMMWIQKWYPKLQRKMILTPDKYLLAKNESHILIDDTEKKCDDFFMAGGTSLLFPQLYNRNFEFANSCRVEWARKKIEEFKFGVPF